MPPKGKLAAFFNKKKQEAGSNIVAAHEARDDPDARYNSFDDDPTLNAFALADTEFGIATTDQSDRNVLVIGDNVNAEDIYRFDEPSPGHNAAGSKGDCFWDARRKEQVFEEEPPAPVEPQQPALWSAKNTERLKPDDFPSLAAAKDVKESRAPAPAPAKPAGTAWQPTSSRAWQPSGRY